MIKKHDDLVGSIVHDVAHLLRLRIDKKLKKFGLTRVKWLALGIIQHNPEITQSELAHKLELGDAATGRLADRLEERGFVERKPERTDRRVKRLWMTPMAKQRLNDMDTVSDELRSEILDGISQDDIKAMERGLKALKSNLKMAIFALFSASVVTSDPTPQRWADTLSYFS